MSGKLTKRDYLLKATPCCGTKPLIYMRPAPHQFCHRCCREYDADTEQQRANWAWEVQPDGTFNPTYDADTLAGEYGPLSRPPSSTGAGQVSGASDHKGAER